MSQFSYSPSYRRNLPHLQPRGAVIFVTFRLTGTLPRALVERHRLEQKWLSHLAETNPTYHELVAEQFERQWFAKFEAVLDRATIGPTWLKDKRIASVLEESLHFRHDSVYRLDAFSIMPNHVHLLMKPLPINDESNYHSLSSIMQSLKVTLRSSVIESWDGTVSFGNMKVSIITFVILKSINGLSPTLLIIL